jgi:hypothetical protein
LIIDPRHADEGSHRSRLKYHVHFLPVMLIIKAGVDSLTHC